MQRHCFACDLKDDPGLIKEYDAYHSKVWPEIQQQLLQSGILQMEIYRVANRLFMIMETGETFNLEAKTRADLLNPIVAEWETLMWNYQQALPFAKPGEKWVPMEKIFSLV